MSMRKTTNWEDKLKDDEITEDGKAVKLKGLRRLAQEAGLLKSYCRIINPSNKMVQCIYRTVFEDGSEWTGAGDCSAANTSADFAKYPTAVAESRAEARALIRALNISKVSAEEIGFAPEINVKARGKIDGNIVGAIERLCKDRGVDLIKVIEEACNDPSRALQISELNQLTTEEGQRAMSYLNDRPLKKVSSRDKLKADLLAEKEKENG